MHLSPTFKLRYLSFKVDAEASAIPLCDQGHAELKMDYVFFSHFSKFFIFHILITRSLRNVSRNKAQMHFVHTYYLTCEVCLFANEP